jgi:hypothetical protein
MTATAEIVQQAEQPQRGGALVRIVDTPANIVTAWKEFESLKKQILTPEDLQPYTVGTGANKQTKHFIKKSGWRKIATAFGISIERTSVDLKHLGDDHIAITHTVRAIAPGGRSCDGVGSCDSHEERFEESVWKKGADGKSYKEPTGKYKWKYNDVDGTAYTRAANRAISDLVGGGEVSAEEMSGVKDVTPAVSEPEYLEQRYQDRLLTVARDRGEEGINKLARLIFNQLGSRFLTKEQAVEIGKQLQAGPSPDKKNQEPANTVDPARSKAAEVFEDAVVTEVPAPGSGGAEEDQDF